VPQPKKKVLQRADSTQDSVTSTPLSSTLGAFDSWSLDLWWRLVLAQANTYTGYTHAPKDFGGEFCPRLLARFGFDLISMILSGGGHRFV
jgi:hypothetical protein